MDAQIPRIALQSVAPRAAGGIRWSVLAMALAAAGAPPATADLLVYAAESTIEAFSDGAQGNVAPARTIAGDNTDLAVSRQIAVDPVHGEVFASSSGNNDWFTVYPVRGDGNLAPLRSIHGPHTGLHQAHGIAVDLVHKEVWVASFEHSNTSTDGVGQITVYPLSADGDAAPLRTIFGPAAGLNRIGYIAVDPVAQEVYLARQGPPAAVLVFDRTANGNVAPKRQITGAATKLGTPYGIAVDPAHGEILLTTLEGAVSVFAQRADGNVAPLRRLAGSATGFSSGDLEGIAVLSGAEIAVASSGDQSVKVFPRTADGNVAPLRQLGGPATGLSGPGGLAVYHKPLLLGGGRFAIEAAWKTTDGNAGGGEPSGITADTGDFWFFSSSNVEVVAKVLNGCGVNQEFWVFAGGLTNVYANLQVTDLATGQVRLYTNRQGNKFAPVQDTAAFATCGAAWPAANDAPQAAAGAAEELGDRAAPLAAPCSAPCLGGRFHVSATWKTPDGLSGSATGVTLTADTGYLWFFSPSNIEVVLKVLNGCGLDNRYWVFAGGLTNLDVALRVFDSATGVSAVYHNPQGQAFQPVQDTSAFATCP